MTSDNRQVRFLVDGDLLVYAAASACHQDFEWAPDAWTSCVNLTEALEKFKMDFERLVESFTATIGKSKAPEVVFCMTGANNFRKEVLPTYKSNRGRKPPGYSKFQKQVEDWLASEGLSVYRREGLEADDCLGILGTHQTSKYRNVIWSRDKDLRMIPCEHFEAGNILEAEEGWDIRHPYQTLIGDTTDGYKGLPGCGPVKAKKIIASGPQEAVWERIEAAYVKAGLTREDMIQQARVAKILTVDDYDLKERKVKLWNPPKPTKL